jgi:predicted outer membrane repeat protein
VPRLDVLEDRSLPSTFLVMNLADSGAGSLRQAVLDANAKPGPDVIRFARGLNGTIALTSGELDLEGSVAIDGPGADRLAVSGSGHSRVFSVGPGAVARLSGLTITGGNAAKFGGGILNAGTLTLTAVAVSGNTAFQVSATDFEFGGGGISNTGTLTIFHSQISNNTLVGTDPPTASTNAITSGGGGINNDGPSAVLAVYNSTLSSNTADDAGGLRNSDGAVLTFVGNVVANNTATETVDGGIGGSDATSAFVAFSLFQGNRVLGHSIDGGTGGGLGSEATDTTVVGCTFVGNSAATFGGGINAFGGGTLTISDSLIVDNSATFGGGLSNLFGSSVVLDNTLLIGNTAAVNGGAVYNQFADLKVHDSVLTGNQAGVNGGGIYFKGGGSLVLDDVLITANQANTAGGTGKGGGLFVAVPPTTPLDLTGAVIVGNSPDDVVGT